MNVLDLLYITAGVLTAPFWARKKRDGWDQRFGHVQSMLDDAPPASEHGGACVMLHAVSVGEVNALRSLVMALCDDDRVSRVVVSATTDTGLKRAQDLFSEHCAIVRYPLDCSWMVDRFLDAVNPDVIGLVELEVWPNFIKRATKRGIPVCVVNGRLSARSFKGYRKLRMLLRPTFSRLIAACVQDEAYAERFLAMGVASDRVRVTDSMKWDSVDVERASNGASDRALSIALSLGLDLTRPIVVAGSTASGEEALLHAACPEGAQLVCAPRKIERFDEASDAMPGCTRRSLGERAPSGQTRFLLDTIGELSAVYELADVVVVGRSFGDLYGSDPIEPAALGKPVVIGPRLSDFLTAVDALVNADAIKISSRETLSADLAALLDDPASGHAMGERARECVRAHQGATAAHHELLVELGSSKDSLGSKMHEM